MVTEYRFYHVASKQPVNVHFPFRPDVNAPIHHRGNGEAQSRTILPGTVQFMAHIGGVPSVKHRGAFPKLIPDTDLERPDYAVFRAVRRHCRRGTRIRESIAASRG